MGRLTGLLFSCHLLRGERVGAAWRGMAWHGWLVQAVVSHCQDEQTKAVIVGLISSSGQAVPETETRSLWMRGRTHTHQLTHTLTHTPHYTLQTQHPNTHTHTHTATHS